MSIPKTVELLNTIPELKKKIKRYEEALDYIANIPDRTSIDDFQNNWKWVNECIDVAKKARNRWGR